MSRRNALAWVVLGLALVGPARAQIPYSSELLPSHTALNRVGLERHWQASVPLGIGYERVLSVGLSATGVTVSGTVADASGTELGFSGNTELSPLNDIYIGSRIVFLDGPLAGQSRTVTGYTGASRRLAFASPFRAGPANGARFSVVDTMVFAQTTESNLYAFDGETGRLLWNQQLGGQITRARPAAVNSRAVFVTNTNRLYALDRQTGRRLWSTTLPSMPAGPPAADEDRVFIGLDSGVLVAYNLHPTSLRGNEGSRTFPLATPTPLNAGPATVEAFKLLAYYREPQLAWNWQTDRPLTSRPLPAGRVVAFGAGDGRVYSALSDVRSLLFRFLTGGGVVGPLAGHGERTLLAPSLDENVYAIDLFTGESLWTFSTGAPVEQEPLVADDDIFVQNSAGATSVLDPATGEARWTNANQVGRFLAVGRSKLYLSSPDRDLFILDRNTGRQIADARSTYQVSGLNLREFTLLVTNSVNDRIYACSPSGSLICLRELDAVVPHQLRDPASKPLGYIPPGGLNAPTAAPAVEPAADPAAPAEPAEPN